MSVSQKFLTSFPLRIVCCIVLGVIVSSIVFFFLISAGYSNISSSGENYYLVDFMGLPIYEIYGSTDNYSGKAVGANMSVLGVAFSFLIVVIVEIVFRMRLRKEPK